MFSGKAARSIFGGRGFHERVILLKVDVEEEPTVGAEERVTVAHPGNSFHTVQARYGF